MKKLKLGAAFFLLLTLTIVSCKKKNDPQPATTTTNNNTNTTNNNNNTTTPAYSYFPTTTGSTWTYAGANSYTATVKGDTVVNGIHYTNLLNSSQPSDKGYIRIDGTDYHSGSFTPSTAIADILDMKEAPVATTWNNDYVVYGYNYRYKMTIDSVGYSKVVHGVTFTDVIKVKQEVLVDVGGGYTLYETDYYYYAKNVGFIQCVLSGGTTYLSSYHIN